MSLFAIKTRPDRPFHKIPEPHKVTHSPDLEALNCDRLGWGERLDISSAYY